MLHNIYSNHYFQAPFVEVPYNGDIPYGLVVGKQIYASGFIDADADNIVFNLLTNSGNAFHMSVRFNQGTVVRNSEVNGNWQWEETDGPLFFRRGQNYELIITVEYDRYRVQINGNHAFDFQHRMPYQNVTRFETTGAHQLNKLVFSSGGANFTETFSPSVPFATQILNGCQPGRIVQITGDVPYESDGFQINFTNSPDGSSIPFVFNPRFDQQCVVRNNYVNGNWQDEEVSQASFPFFKGSAFELLFFVDENQYNVAVNGERFATFSHRSPISEANFLEIQGNVNITSVRQY